MTVHLCCRFLLAIAIAAVLGPLSAADPPSATSIEHTTVFHAGESGYHTFRIPSLLAAGKTLLAFSEARVASASDAGDIDLVLKRSTDGGRTWGALQVVWNDGPNTCGNPCPVVDRRTGRIILLMTHNLGEDDESEIKTRTSRGTRTVWVCHSDDEGAAWSTPRDITADAKHADWTWYATGPGIGIQIEQGPHAGRLVIPCDHAFLVGEQGAPPRSEFGSHAIYSDDGGKSWTYGNAIAPQMNECQVIELADGEGGLLIDMRSYRGQGCRAQSTSDDGGVNWTPPRDVPVLVEPVCQASLIRAAWPDGDHYGVLAFSNPSDAKKRIRMTLRTSLDDGKTWNAGVVLHDGPSAYSCLAALPDGTLACLYERGEKSAYETIVLARVPAKELAH